MLQFSREIPRAEDFTLDDIYEVLSVVKDGIDELNTALIDIAEMRHDPEMKALKSNLEDAWMNAYRMVNKIKKELN